MFCIAATILISQVIVFWYFLGFSWILVAICGTLIGAFTGLFVFWSYSELKLFIQDLSKVDVAGKCVLITGCDCGFGLQLAESLAKRGMFVFAGVLNLDSTGASNLKPLRLVKVIKMDVTVEEDVKQAFETVKQHLASTKTVLWAVVNNAGIFHFRMMQFTDIKIVRKLIEVNTLGMLRVCQTFSPLLRGHGRIVNIVSTLGQFLNPCVGGYCASKFASDAISKALRIEMYPLGLPVITINPYGYNTALFHMDYKWYTDEDIAVYGKKFFLKFEESLKHSINNLNKNTYEVIHSLESAILNQKFQYNYIPNFKIRLLIAFNKCLSEEQVTKNGCPYFWVGMPTTLN